MRFYLKACPRCSGDLMLAEAELGEPELVCIQCGYSKGVSALREAGRRRREMAVAGAGAKRSERGGRFHTT